MKRIISFLVCAAIFISLGNGLPGQAFAADGSRIYSSSMPISDLSQITDLNGDYKLTENIQLPLDFSPIGTEEAPFTGTFDGGGFTITAAEYISLFGYTENAYLANIMVENSVVKSTGFFGGIVAHAGGTTVIENSSFSGQLNVSGGLAVNGGGIVGMIDKEAVVTNCYANVSLEVDAAPLTLNVGGIAGRNKGTVELCQTEGTLNAQTGEYRLNIGGIVGENKGRIVGCLNGAGVSGTVNAKATQVFAGGIVGYNNGGAVLRSVNTSVVSGSGNTLYPAYAGGVAGNNLNGTLDTVKNEAQITALKAFAGGIAALNLGHKDVSEISDALNNGELVCSESIAGGIAASNISTDENGGSADIGYVLNLDKSKAIGKNNDGDGVSNSYSMGANDGISTGISEESLKADGIQPLETHDKIWRGHKDIAGLPDMLVVYDEAKPMLIPSSFGNSDALAYYLYSPNSGTYVQSIIAAYYNDEGRFIDLSYVKTVEQGEFVRLTADNIPPNTASIKLIAFAKPLAEGIVPAGIKAPEIPYQKR